MMCPQCSKPMRVSGKMFVCEPCRNFVIVLNASPKSVPPLPEGRQAAPERERRDDRARPEDLQAQALEEAAPEVLQELLLHLDQVQ
jgi:hypothetical protein